MGQISTCFRGPATLHLPPTPPLHPDSSSDRWSSSDWSTCEDGGGGVDTELWASLGGPPDIPYASEFIEHQITLRTLQIANQKTDTFYSDVNPLDDRERRVQFADSNKLVTYICDAVG